MSKEKDRKKIKLLKHFSSSLWVADASILAKKRLCFLLYWRGRVASPFIPSRQWSVTFPPLLQSIPAQQFDPRGSSHTSFQKQNPRFHFFSFCLFDQIDLNKHKQENLLKGIWESTFWRWKLFNLNNELRTNLCLIVVGSFVKDLISSSSKTSAFEQRKERRIDDKCSFLRRRKLWPN